MSSGCWLLGADQSLSHQNLSLSKPNAHSFQCCPLVNLKSAQQKLICSRLGSVTSVLNSISISAIHFCWSTIRCCSCLSLLQGNRNCSELVWLAGVLQRRKWENCMTIDRKSWGYRREASLAQYFEPGQLISILVETVRCALRHLLKTATSRKWFNTFVLSSYKVIHVMHKGLKLILKEWPTA